MVPPSPRDLDVQGSQRLLSQHLQSGLGWWSGMFSRGGGELEGQGLWSKAP